MWEKNGLSLITWSWYFGDPRQWGLHEDLDLEGCVPLLYPTPIWDEAAIQNSYGSSGPIPQVSHTMHCWLLHRSGSASPQREDAAARISFNLGLRLPLYSVTTILDLNQFTISWRTQTLPHSGTED